VAWSEEKKPAGDPRMLPIIRKPHSRQGTGCARVENEARKKPKARRALSRSVGVKLADPEGSQRLYHVAS
jgi:hypothetical protein